MNNYSVDVIESSKELTARERIRVKDTTNAIHLDDVTQKAESPLVISPDYYAVLHVTNPASDNKEYNVFVVVDKGGNKYVTGSESFFESFVDIFRELKKDGDDDFEIEVNRVDSKNYKGKQFLSCSLV